jgi:hypothetical protein
MRSRTWLRGLCVAGVGTVALGTIVCGLGLIDLVVRPNVIQAVDTLGLLGITGLILLPILTLSLASLDLKAALGVEVADEDDAVAMSQVSAVPMVATIDDTLAPADEARIGRSLAARRSYSRAVAGDLLTDIATELAESAEPAPAPAPVIARAMGSLDRELAAELASVPSSGPSHRLPGRVATHEPRRREGVHRRVSGELRLVEA